MSIEYTEKFIFVNPETYVEDEQSAYLKKIVQTYANSIELDTLIASVAVSEQEETRKYFETALDQVCYFSDDHKKIRNFIINWYAANKTVITKARNLSDLNSLTNEELNEFLLSMGFPYPRNIISRSHKIQFLRELINNYRKKGTPAVLGNVLSLYGLRNVLISEWWIKYDSRRSDPFYARSNVIHSTANINDIRNPDLETTRTYEDFISDNPHWQLSLADLSSKFYDSSTKIKLPSITNSFSIEAYTNLTDINVVVSILQRKMQETYDFFLRYTLIPDDKVTTVPIYTGVYNTPPDTSSLDDGSYFLVGNEGTGDWSSQDKKIAVFNSDTTSWSFFNPTNGYTILVEDTDMDVIENNQLLICNKLTPSSPNKWDSYQLKTNYTINVRDKTLDTTTTFVYNGTELVDLEAILPNSKLNNRNENIFRDISLNNFSSLYSVFEIMLAFAYLHNGSYTENTLWHHLNYNGNYTPLDFGYQEYYDSSAVPTRDDIDTLYYLDSGYSVILDEYNNLIFDTDIISSGGYSFRHNYYGGNSPRSLQKDKQFDYIVNWTKKNNYESDSHLYVQNKAEKFLKAVNPEFLDEINTLLQNDTSDLVMENMLVDFENYIYNTMNLNVPSSAYVQFGGQFLQQKMIDVINFFKPFRARLLDFITKLLIDNPLLDSLLPDDVFGINVEILTVEKPYPRNIDTSGVYMYNPDTSALPVLDYKLDYGLSTEDSVITNIEIIENELHYGTYDSDDKINVLDLNMADAFFIEVYDGTGGLEFEYSIDDGETVTYDSTSGEEIIYPPVDQT